LDQARNWAALAFLAGSAPVDQMPDPAYI